MYTSSFGRLILLASGAATCTWALMAILYRVQGLAGPCAMNGFVIFMVLVAGVTTLACALDNRLDR
jgi:hypothetical protein